MRRRVVCPRSHPASLYVRSLLGSFPVARCAFPGDTPDPESLYVRSLLGFFPVAAGACPGTLGDPESL